MSDYKDNEVYTFTESLSPEETQKAKHCGFDLENSKNELGALIEKVNNLAAYCNSTELLKKFTSISSMYWSMLCTPEEWDTNGLKKFRSAFMLHIETNEPFKDRFNTTWVINQITIKYSQFKIIDETLYCPSWLYMLGIIALGVVAGVLIATFLLDTPEFKYCIGATIVATLLCEILTFKNYLSEINYLAKEKEAFIGFRCEVKKILKDKNIPSDEKIPEGLKSEDPYEFLSQKRRSKSILNWTVRTLFAPKNYAPNPEASPAVSPANGPK